MSHRKQSVERDHKDRIREMMDKLNNSRKAVDAYMKEKDHKNEILTERKRLIENDMKNNHERNKRLQDRRKVELKTKDVQDYQLYKEVKQRER